MIHIYQNFNYDCQNIQMYSECMLFIVCLHKCHKHPFTYTITHIHTDTHRENYILCTDTWNPFFSCEAMRPTVDNVALIRNKIAVFTAPDNNFRLLLNIVMDHQNKDKHRQTVYYHSVTTT